jgi:MFS family permease
MNVNEGVRTKADNSTMNNSPNILMNELKIDFGRLRSVHRPFGKFKRKLIFLLIFYLNILINIDHGAIPAATTILKRELNLDNVSLGTIGSLVYLGLVLGAISAGPIFSAYSSKWVVCVGLITTCFFLYFFTVSESQFPLALSRVGCGFFQVIYYNISRCFVTYTFLYGWTSSELLLIK